jgi:hypothetical protein
MEAAHQNTFEGAQKAETYFGSVESKSFDGHGGESSDCSFCASSGETGEHIPQHIQPVSRIYSSVTMCHIIEGLRDRG